MSAEISTEKSTLRAPAVAFARGNSVTPQPNMEKTPANLFFVPGILLLGAAKPEHSIHNAIFWLLVLLAVFIATLAVKVVFLIVDREIELWRNRRT